MLIGRNALHECLDADSKAIRSADARKESP